MSDEGVKLKRFSREGHTVAAVQPAAHGSDAAFHMGAFKCECCEDRNMIFAVEAGAYFAKVMMPIDMAHDVAMEILAQCAELGYAPAAS